MDEKCISEMCGRYSSGAGLEELCKIYHLGKLKIKSILNENGIAIRSKGGVKQSNNFVVDDYHINKFPKVEGYYYIVVDKITGEEFNDIENKGGHLTTHIEKEYGVATPSLYDRRKYYMETGNYWWEQWFDVKLVKECEVKKCPYCDWTTTDLENRSGMFLTHLKNAHNITIEQYLIEHPEDKAYFAKQTALVEKREKLNQAGNYVICPICGEKLEKITYWHIHSKHNMEYDEFKRLYPNVKMLSDNMFEQTKSAQAISNLTVSKKRFVSKYEKELQELLRNRGIKFSPNRQLLIGKEIDMMIEDKKIGIEFDGLKWHTEWFGKKDRLYHLNKTKKCNEKGYGLIHVFEDEYVDHREIVENKILHILGVSSANEKIPARKCVIKEIYKHDAEEFLNKYHIQGFVSSTLYLGAYYQEKLIAVMTFKCGNLRTSGWELTRFASDYNYICQGVGGKLFKYFVKTYVPQKVTSFADRRWTINVNDNLYTKLGFKFEKVTPPDYTYYNDRVDKYKRFHKLYFNKKKLSKQYGFPMTMTETEMAKELGYDRIWNCGLIKYVWKKE